MYLSYAFIHISIGLFLPAIAMISIIAASDQQEIHS